MKCSTGTPALAISLPRCYAEGDHAWDAVLVGQAACIEAMVPLLPHWRGLCVHRTVFLSLHDKTAMDFVAKMKMTLLLVSIGMCSFVVAEQCAESSGDSQIEPDSEGYEGLYQDLRMLLSFAGGIVCTQLLQRAGRQDHYHGDGEDDHDDGDFIKHLPLYVFAL